MTWNRYVPFRPCHTVSHSSSKSSLKAAWTVLGICESSLEVDKLALQLNVSNLRPDQVPRCQPTWFNKNCLMFCCQGEWVKWTQRGSTVGVDPKLILNFRVTDYWKFHFAVSWFRRLRSLFHCLWSLGKGSEVCQATEGRKQHRLSSLIRDWVSSQNSVFCLLSENTCVTCSTCSWWCPNKPVSIVVTAGLWLSALCERDPNACHMWKNSLLLHGVLVSWTHLRAVWS